MVNVICTKYGQLDISKDPTERTIFPGDQIITMYGNHITYSLKESSTIDYKGDPIPVEDQVKRFLM